MISDLEGSIKRARSNGIIAIIAMGTNHSSNKRVLEISKKYDNFIFPAIGIHPWDVEKGNETALKFISEKIDDIVAIGEVGLDYWTKTSKETQLDVFNKILKIATSSKKPLVVHSRGAWEDAFHYVSSSNLEKVIFHWYSGPRDVLKKIVDYKYFISASLAANYSKHHREAIKYVPPENLILETDSPVKYKGVASEPADAIKVLRVVAELKDMRIGSLAEITTKNVEKIFELGLI